MGMVSPLDALAAPPAMLALTPAQGAVSMVALAVGAYLVVGGIGAGGYLWMERRRRLDV